MCNPSGIDFGRRSFSSSDIEGKRVLEVGSRDVNGTFREVVIPLKPGEYIGVDIQEGPGVDEICDVSKLVEKFGKESFDIVISTEMIEHVRDWRIAISQFKGVLKPNGVLVITTRSKGFPYHDYPGDFWRYEIDDMREIFSDMQIDAVESDVPTAPGVFVKAVKPTSFIEKDLKQVALYSMLKFRRSENVSDIDNFLYPFRSLKARFLVRASNSLHYRLGLSKKTR